MKRKIIELIDELSDDSVHAASNDSTRSSSPMLNPGSSLRTPMQRESIAFSEPVGAPNIEDLQFDSSYSF